MILQIATVLKLASETLRDGLRRRYTARRVGLCETDAARGCDYFPPFTRRTALGAVRYPLKVEPLLNPTIHARLLSVAVAVAV